MLPRAPSIPVEFIDQVIEPLEISREQAATLLHACPFADAQPVARAPATTKERPTYEVVARLLAEGHNQAEITERL